MHKKQCGQQVMVLADGKQSMRLLQNPKNG
jgi:hypothetical protein